MHDNCFIIVTGYFHLRVNSPVQFHFAQYEETKLNQLGQVKRKEHFSILKLAVQTSGHLYREAFLLFHLASFLTSLAY